MSWPERPVHQTRPWVLGHRGDSARAPENTLSAFQLALDAGADGVELDVRLSADGHVIVLHDRDCSRVTGGHVNERAENMPLSRLMGLVLARGEHIPTLDQVLSWAKANGARLNVELKSDVADPSTLVQAVLQCIDRAGLPEGHVLLSSFGKRIVQELSQQSSVPVALLVDSRIKLRQALEQLPSLGVTIVHPRHTLLNGSTLTELKRRGYVVNTWTVNQPERARQLSANGVGTIITDTPAPILSALST